MAKDKKKITDEKKHSDHMLDKMNSAGPGRILSDDELKKEREKKSDPKNQSSSK